MHGWEMNCGLSPLNLRQICIKATTLIDSLDTLLILGLQAEFTEAVNAAATLDLEHSEECIVNLSEWNIQVP
jgi:hypothetical protein